MTTARQALSRADFEAWAEAPWFKQFLDEQIEYLDAQTNECAKSVLVCPSEHIEELRTRALVIAGRVSAMEDLRDLTWEDAMEEVEDGGS